MAEFKLNRNLTIRSVTGHTVRFEKGVPTFVPPALIPEAVAVGAERLDMVQEPLAGDPVEDKPEPQGQEREELVFEGFRELMKRNERGDFTAQGMPKTSALGELLGFVPDGKERDVLWAKFMEQEAESK